MKRGILGHRWGARSIAVAGTVLTFIFLAGSMQGLAQIEECQTTKDVKTKKTAAAAAAARAAKAATDLSATPSAGVKPNVADVEAAQTAYNTSKEKWEKAVKELDNAKKGKENLKSDLEQKEADLKTKLAEINSLK